jgi:hypothetical protein
MTIETATGMVWELAGQPRRDTLPASLLPGRCAVCGALADETVPVKATVGNATFTDQYLLAVPSSGRTCYPCAWVMSGKPPDCLRTWTVACAPGLDLGPSHPKSAPVVPAPGPGLLLTARNDMRPVARLLTSPPGSPWCIAVAESGQKHALPWTPVNHGGGRWRVRMDALDVHGTPEVFRTVLGHAAALRAAGFTAAEIEALDPGGKLRAATLPAWREHAVPLSPWQRSPLLHLACFIPNKEHSEHYTSHYAAA